MNNRTDCLSEKKKKRIFAHTYIECAIELYGSIKNKR